MIPAISIGSRRTFPKVNTCGNRMVSTMAIARYGIVILAIFGPIPKNVSFSICFDLADTKIWRKPTSQMIVQNLITADENEPGNQRPVYNDGRNFTSL
jgi:hypothetical protein